MSYILHFWGFTWLRTLPALLATLFVIIMIIIMIVWDYIINYNNDIMGYKVKQNTTKVNKHVQSEWLCNHLTSRLGTSGPSSRYLPLATLFERHLCKEITLFLYFEIDEDDNHCCYYGNVDPQKFPWWSSNKISIDHSNTTQDTACWDVHVILQESSSCHMKLLSLTRNVTYLWHKGTQKTLLMM